MSKISFWQEGEGKDLVFLHGYLAGKESFYPLFEYFSKFYRVTAFDFPGFGGSEPISSAYSVEDYALITREFLAERGVSFPHVIAHSFGCRVAIKCLSKEDCFDRAVLCGAAGVVKKRGLKYRARVRAYRIVKRLFPRFAEARFGSAEYRTLSPIMRESYKKIVNEDLRGDAEKITRPVLFLNGEKDLDTPTPSVRLLQERIEGSRLVEVSGAGHFAFLDNPLYCQLQMEEFFRG